MDTVAHEAPAMSLADMPTTDEGAIDFRRLVEQCVNAIMEMAVDKLAGEGVRRNGYRGRGLRTVIGEMGSRVPGSGRAATSPTGCSGPTPTPAARWRARQRRAEGGAEAGDPGEGGAARRGGDAGSVQAIIRLTAGVA